MRGNIAFFPAKVGGVGGRTALCLIRAIFEEFRIDKVPRVTEVIGQLLPLVDGHVQDLFSGFSSHLVSHPGILAVKLFQVSFLHLSDLFAVVVRKH